MRVLVTGGGGYIGSHMVKLLAGNGYDVVTYDDFSTGHRDAVVTGDIVVGDIRDRDRITETLRNHAIEAVIHFAARSLAGASLDAPDLYYQVNTCGSRALLDAMRSAGVDTLVFSSTAAVYGEPAAVPISEDAPKCPLNPYGSSKRMVECMLADQARAFGLRAISLRYFNAAGADPDGEVGERHDPETHLIPIACQAASGRRSAMTVFARDYDTADGTCVRDYVHVADLCDAHLCALRYLADGGAPTAVNVGYGRGASVQEVIDTVERVSGATIAVEEGMRRAGDPARLIADPARARQVLGWVPQRERLDEIVADAWRWESLGRWQVAG